MVLIVKESDINTLISLNENFLKEAMQKVRSMENRLKKTKTLIQQVWKHTDKNKGIDPVTIVNEANTFF